jgi:hypothetical protein
LIDPTAFKDINLKRKRLIIQVSEKRADGFYISMKQKDIKKQ